MENDEELLLDTTPAQRAQRELRRRVERERCRYYTPCGKIEEFLNILKQFKANDPDIKILILRAGNGIGKSALACNIASYLALRKPNKWFDCIPYLKDFRRPNRGRIYTTTTAASTTYQVESEKWFPQDSVIPYKDGHSFYWRWRFANKSVFYFFLFGQDLKEAESISLDWSIIDEPPPFSLWPAIKTRLRRGGLIVFVLTPLEDAAWIQMELETPARLGKDVFVLQADTEAACIEHGVRGYIPHATIEAQMRDFDEETIAARKGGDYLHLAGAVYKKYAHKYHVLPDYLPYHQECLKTGHYNTVNVIDPHPRKPFAIGWYHVFPNSDIVCFCEWPDDTYPLFHKINSGDMSTEAYAEMMKETETQFKDPVTRRLADPNMTNSPNSTGGETIKQVFARCGLYYQDPIDNLVNGHQAVRSMLGNPAKGVRPSFYILDYCHNHIFGMQNYGWKKKRPGSQDIPELEYKDFPDLVRYGAMSGFKYTQPARFRKALPPVWLPKAFKRKRS